MPEKTKPDAGKKKAPDKKLTEIENADEDVCETNQKKRSYYYDDAHGYEIYNPDEDDED